MSPKNDELVLSLGTSRKDTNWRPVRMHWSDLLKRLSCPKRTAETAEEFAAMPRDQRAEIKDVGGFVGGRVNGGNRKGANVGTRQLLTLDADYGTMELWDAWTAMYAEAACVYSTHSHTPENPRLRFVLPLKREVDREEYEAIARLVASWMGIESFDDTTYQPHRLMYWPSCPKDGEYIFQSQDGPWLDPDEVLAQYVNWHDVSEWPVSSRQKSQLRKHADTQGDPLAKQGIVGAFNRAYSITQAIERFLPGTYTPAGDGRYTYVAGHTTGGLVLYDGDTFAYSHHDTDPCSGQLCNAFDLVRIHLYGVQDEGVPDTEPMTARPSYKAMQELIRNDGTVLNELHLGRTTAGEDFGEEYTGLDCLDRDYTDQGNAVQFAERFRHVLRHHKAIGWLYWDGKVWQQDTEASAKRLLMRFTDDLLTEATVAVQLATDPESQKAAKAFQQWAIRSRATAHIEGTLKLAKAILDEADQSIFDADPWLLNTPDGVVDLRTGEMLPHDSKLMCTMITSVSPDPEMKKPLFDKFLYQLTGGDQEYADYLQMIAGMSAVGKVYEEGLVISHGPGSNGKSTFFGAWQQVLGGYATTISADILMARQPGREIVGMAEVRGKRLVITSETEEGAKLGVSVMKRLTSRDPISARALYKNPITFIPTHTLVMHTNFLPSLKSLDGGTRRRIAIAPFTMSLKPDEVIKDFGDKLLREEGPAILRWIIEGAMKFFKANMTIKAPEAIVKATTEYLDGEDWLSTFLADCCEVDEEYSVMSGSLYAAYVNHAKANGDYQRTNKAFASEMERRGFTKKRMTAGVKWFGLKLSDAAGL